MWAQQWNNIYEYVIPYPESPGFDITPELKQVQSIFGYIVMFMLFCLLTLFCSYYLTPMQKIQKYQTEVELFEVANEFFTSLNLPSMEMSYGEKAMIVRPDDGREVECHASAWDFCDKEDFR